MNKYIHLRSKKFPILPEEEDELVNPGMYGKALALYLQDQLKNRGYDASFICCEDWGWWIELKAPFRFGVCIYCGPVSSDILDLYCTDGAISKKAWSWRKFRFFDTSPWVEKLHEDMASIFQSDPDIQVLSTCLEEPNTV
ncbi:MAG: hypothetical protein ING36_01405 [Burkholderiales bacterium]|jgi:hypothetical protein|nr:hypothetical protein [Burkholderiales bacterium]